VPSLFLHHRRVAASQCRRCAASARRGVAVLVELLRGAGRPLFSLRLLVSRSSACSRADTRRGAACWMLGGRASVVSNGHPPAVWLARRTGQAGDPHARLADLRRLSGAGLARQETGHLCASLLHWAPTRRPQHGATLRQLLLRSLRLLQLCHCSLFGCLTPYTRQSHSRLCARTRTLQSAPHPGPPRLARALSSLSAGTWRELARTQQARCSQL